MGRDKNGVCHLYTVGKGGQAISIQNHTAWPPFPANFQWVHISQTDSSEQKYLVYITQNYVQQGMSPYTSNERVFSYMFYQALFCVGLRTFVSK